MPGSSSSLLVRTPLLLVRHGQTPWNATGRWQGHGDPGLSALGREQADEVARRLPAMNVGWQGILTSDLSRALETAEVLAAALTLSVEVDVRLRELDVGRWTGLTRAEIAAIDPHGLAAFESGDPAVRPGDGESRLAIRERVKACIGDWSSRFAGQAWIVVTHLGVIRALVPGSEPTNADCLHVVAEELLADVEPALHRGPEGPL